MRRFCGRSSATCTHLRSDNALQISAARRHVSPGRCHLLDMFKNRCSGLVARPRASDVRRNPACGAPRRGRRRCDRLREGREFLFENYALNLKSETIRPLGGFALFRCRRRAKRQVVDILSMSVTGDDAAEDYKDLAFHGRSFQGE